MNEQNNISNAVVLIKTAILQSQARAAAAVNQEQLALYYGIGKFISLNTRSGEWGTGAIKQISEKLNVELPGLRGFSEANIKKMRLFYEQWQVLENRSPSANDLQEIDFEPSIDFSPILSINRSPLANDLNLMDFVSLGFTLHYEILSKTSTIEERVFYIHQAATLKWDKYTLRDQLKKDLYHHQGKIANNFLSTMPDYKQAFRAIQMFKDEYLLDFINVEELGVRDEEVDERVIENSIVHNVKNFIMTFGKGFAFIGNQVHFDKLGHDHWVDLLFYNRDLERTVVFELKAGGFKVAYLAQLSAYLRILNDDDRRANEKAPIGIILCKEADKTYVEYVMQDFKQPMGVATYKTAEEMDPELLQVLPPKEELQKLLQNASHKEENL
ncbi:MAG: PDDEXK nuclease domain-containing protein [Bacteroidales bacterium]|nr:PDDEXK nuclease domain-containing protein [Bacteroidales bacterium]